MLGQIDFHKLRAAIVWRGSVDYLRNSQLKDIRTSPTNSCWLQGLCRTNVHAWSGKVTYECRRLILEERFWRRRQRQTISTTATGDLGRRHRRRQTTRPTNQRDEEQGFPPIIKAGDRRTGRVTSQVHG